MKNRKQPCLSPVQAIRRKCLECVCGEVSEIKKCTATSDKCEIFPFRMGYGKPDWSHGHKKCTRLQAIRKECVRVCMNHHPNYVPGCPSVNCDLFCFRSGHWPHGSAIRSKRADLSGLAKPQSTKIEQPIPTPPPKEFSGKITEESA